MTSFVWHSIVLALALIVTTARPASAGLIMGLETTSVTQNTAQIRVLALFEGGDDGSSDNDSISSLMLSLQGSDSLLTSNGTDFSRFSFDLQLADFLASPGFDPQTGIVGIFSPNPVDGPFLTPSLTPYLLGTITVDLTGLAIGTSVTVTIAGGVSPLQTDAAGLLDGDSVDSFAETGQLTFENGSVDITLVPEPATLTLAAIATSLLTLGSIRRAHRPNTRLTRVADPVAQA